MNLLNFISDLIPDLTHSFSNLHLILCIGIKDVFAQFCHSVSCCVISVQYCDWEMNVLIPESFMAICIIVSRGGLALRLFVFLLL